MKFEEAFVLLKQGRSIARPRDETFITMDDGNAVIKNKSLFCKCVAFSIRCRGISLKEIDIVDIFADDWQIFPKDMGDLDVIIGIKKSSYKSEINTLIEDIYKECSKARVEAERLKNSPFSNKQVDDMRNHLVSLAEIVKEKL